MKYFLLLFLLSFNAYANFADVKFGRYQIADSQWNVSVCMYTATCQIYSKNPGTAYKIPWTTGQLSWAAGDYIAFVETGNSTNPWKAIQYNSSGTQKAVMGNGRVINMGADYFFFVGSDNNTGQLFSPTIGMNTNAGVTWIGTLNPSITQLNTASANWTTTPLSSGQTYTAAPSLCCGGSSATFQANTTNTAKVVSFVNRTTADSQVYIEQIGDNNSITVQQTGTKNNYTKYVGNGFSNNITVTQTAANNTQTNYADISVSGNNNTVNVEQVALTETNGFSKGAFVTVSDNNNNITINQKNAANDYASVILSGGNKTVNVTQQGNGSHMADITLSGQPAALTLTQSGSTQQNYSINFNCSTVGGCAAIQVQQGQ